MQAFAKPPSFLLPKTLDCLITNETAASVLATLGARIASVRYCHTAPYTALEGRSGRCPGLHRQFDTLNSARRVLVDPKQKNGIHATSFFADTIFRGGNISNTPPIMELLNHFRRNVVAILILDPPCRIVDSLGRLVKTRFMKSGISAGGTPALKNAAIGAGARSSRTKILTGLAFKPDRMRRAIAETTIASFCPHFGRRHDVRIY
jgi:hypothetical protein